MSLFASLFLLTVTHSCLVHSARYSIASNQSAYFLKLPKRCLCTGPPSPQEKLEKGPSPIFPGGRLPTEWREPFDFSNRYFQFWCVDLSSLDLIEGLNTYLNLKKSSMKHYVKWKVIRRPNVEATYCCDHLQSPHVRGSKTLLDSGFHAIDPVFQYWIADSLSVEFGFRIPIVGGIPDSLSCITDSKDQNSGLHSKHLMDSWIRILVHRWHLWFCLPFSFVISVCPF